MIKAVGDHPIKQLVDNSLHFTRYITCRKTPMEPANLMQKQKEIEDLVLADPAKFKLPKFPEEGDEFGMKNFLSRKRQKVKEIVKQRVYGWHPIVYDQPNALQYLIGRSAVEFAVLLRIFKEIEKRDPEFKPTSFFDYGSGVGTGVWAAAELWKSSIFEYYLVDSSKYMNDLSDLILRDGNENKQMSLRNVFYRQFLPAQGHKYDLVLSAYTMFEMPSLKHRLEVANNLWNKAQDYLVFVEVGTNAGFTALNEIRSYLMKVKNVNEEDAFIFAPCTHESSCPRYELNDGTPCNYEIKFIPLSCTGTQVPQRDTFSYLVIKKGSPSAEDRWPRIVRPILERHKHVHCRMCTEEGKIDDGIFTVKRHGKLVYRCVKKSNWGDRLPIKIQQGEAKADGEYFSDDDTDDESDHDEAVKSKIKSRKPETKSSSET